MSSRHHQDVYLAWLFPTDNIPASPQAFLAANNRTRTACGSSVTNFLEKHLDRLRNARRLPLCIRPDTYRLRHGKARFRRLGSTCVLKLSKLPFNAIVLPLFTDGAAFRSSWWLARHDSSNAASLRTMGTSSLMTVVRPIGRLESMTCWL